MAFALIANTAKYSSDATNVTTDAVDSTGGNLALAVLTSSNVAAFTSSPTDSKGNSWTGLTKRSSPDTVYVARIWYSATPTVGSGHTASYSEAAFYGSMGFSVYSGADAAPADAENGAGTNSGTSLACGSVTPSADGALIVAVLCSLNLTGVSIDSGFTIIDDVGGNATNRAKVVVAYMIQTTAAAVNPTWSWTGTAGAAAAIASFKVAAAASAIKTINGLARASVKTINGLAIASVKKFLGLA